MGSLNLLSFFFYVNRYALENLKFGKIDVGRYPDAAKKYGINDSSMSRQLPTVILFRSGKEVTRRPAADDRGKLIKFFFTEVNYPENPKLSYHIMSVCHECWYLNLNTY